MQGQWARRRGIRHERTTSPTVDRGVIASQRGHRALVIVDGGEALQEDHVSGVESVEQGFVDGKFWKRPNGTHDVDAATIAPNVGTVGGIVDGGCGNVKYGEVGATSTSPT